MEWMKWFWFVACSIKKINLFIFRNEWLYVSRPNKLLHFINPPSIIQLSLIKQKKSNGLVVLPAAKISEAKVAERKLMKLIKASGAAEMGLRPITHYKDKWNQPPPFHPQIKRRQQFHHSQINKSICSFFNLLCLICWIPFHNNNQTPSNAAPTQSNKLIYLLSLLAWFDFVFDLLLIWILWRLLEWFNKISSNKGGLLSFILLWELDGRN